MHLTTTLQASFQYGLCKTEQNRCIAGPIPGRVFNTRKVMFYNTANDLRKIRICERFENGE